MHTLTVLELEKSTCYHYEFTSNTIFEDLEDQVELLGHNPRECIFMWHDSKNIFYE